MNERQRTVWQILNYRVQLEEPEEAETPENQILTESKATLVSEGAPQSFSCLSSAPKK